MVARDPVGAVLFFYHTVRGVLRDLLCIEAPVVGTEHLPADGCAWSGRPALFGGVDAVFGVTESQNRGTLHLHAFVWVLREWQASDPVSAIQRRYYGATGLRARFLRWLEWTSHESVATLPAKLGAPSEETDTSHLGPARRVAAADDEEVPEAVDAAAQTAEALWLERSGREVTQPLTGATASRLGPFHERPSFYCPAAAHRHGADGSAAPQRRGEARADDAEDAAVEALAWTRAALDDARDIAADMGVHGCRPGCWARRRGVGVVCRHGFFDLEADGPVGRAGGEAAGARPGRS